MHLSIRIFPIEQIRIFGFSRLSELYMLIISYVKGTR